MKPFVKLVGVCGVLSAFVFAGSGCASVYVSAPVGSKPQVLEPAAWNGIWVTQDGSCQLHVTDPAAGRLQMIEVKVRESGLTLETSFYVVHAAGNFLFANRDCSEEKPGQYMWFRIRRDGDQLLVWWPDPDKFRQLVRAGKVQGRIEDDNVYLAPLSDDEVRRLISTEPGSIFHADAPGILRRVHPTRERAGGETS